jgi:hypothetical protein
MSPALAEPIDDVKTNHDVITIGSISSNARAEASRANGRMSHGPTTPEGKERSRRNGCKDGLTGAGIVLPPEAEAEVNRRYAEFARDLQPRNTVESDLVRQMALGSWRSQVLNIRINEHDARLNAARFANWEQDEQIGAAALGQKLAENPELVVLQLRRSTAGCDWLMDRWEILGDGLADAEDEGGPSCAWTDADLGLALNLLGRPLELRHLDGQARELRALREQAGAGSNEAVIELRAIIEQEVAGLETKRAEVWEGIEVPRLQAWRAGVDIDLGPEGTRLRRYEAAAHRLYNSAWNKLERLRKEKGQPMMDRSTRAPDPDPAPAPVPEPAAAPAPPPAPAPTPAAAPAPVTPSARVASVVTDVLEQFQQRDPAMSGVDQRLVDLARNGFNFGAILKNKTNPTRGQSPNGERGR